MLSGTVEFGETYVLEFSKGSRLINREAWKRGEASHYREISNEQECIVTTSDRC